MPQEPHHTEIRMLPRPKGNPHHLQKAAEARDKIKAAIAQGSRSQAEIRQETGLPISVISRHLRNMVDEGVVRVTLPPPTRPSLQYEIVP